MATAAKSVTATFPYDIHLKVQIPAGSAAFPFGAIAEAHDEQIIRPTCEDCNIIVSSRSKKPISSPRPGIASPKRTLVGFVLEKLMTGLRTSDGVDLGVLWRGTGVDVRAAFPDILAVALRQGLLAAHRDALRATRAGTRVLDAVLRRFFAEA